MKNRKMIIWSNADMDIDNWDFSQEEEDYGPITDDEKWNRMTEINADYLEDERANLDIKLGSEIIILADLGLWNGRQKGVRIIGSGNIKDCLSSECDYVTWYCDRYDFRCEAVHHDGTNHYLYRVLKEDLTSDQRSHFFWKIWHEGNLDEKMIRRYTRSIRPEIAKVYGWK